ncbi:MAG: TolC family protein [Bacteroidales bacterium]|nr:TolC family protein [Bacteroidales bacterium]MCF8403531.1 TolC family protein [Bacteroidales bacterium]
MKKYIVVLLLIFIGWTGFSQTSISLEACYKKAIANYPLTRQGELLNASNELSIKNLNKNYLPQLNINGQVHYQSDVTKMPFENAQAFGVEELSKDWYKIMLDVNQVIYDGKATSRQKELEEVNLEINQQNLEVEFFSLKQRINQVYFGIILLKKNQTILQIHKETLSKKLADVQSGVKNGILLPSNEDILQVELIQLEQALEELEISIASSINILNEFTNLSLNSNTEFDLPDISIENTSFINNRPEYVIFSMQHKKIDVSKKMLGSKKQPRLSAFGQAGYGRPGYDMLKNQFDDFYMVGARLSWSFWDWNHTKKEKEILSLQQEIVNTQKETFDKNIRIDLQNKKALIQQKESQISKDDEIIQLREKISASSSSQLSNGVITSTEYLTELNAESKAKLDLEVHKVELIKAKLDYQTTLGNI